MDEAIALMALGGVMRQAIRLIRGVQIKQDQQQFEMAVFSVLSWFKVRRHRGLLPGLVLPHLSTSPYRKTVTYLHMSNGS